MVDASMRILARSKTIRSIRLRALLWTAGLTWGLTWLLVFAALRASKLGLLLGLFAALIYALYYPRLNRITVEKRLRKLHKETFGDTNDFACEVELTPSGICLRQQWCQSTIEWGKVEEILVTTDSVDIFTPGAGLIVRSRAFKSPDEQKQFVALAQSYFDAARQAESSTR